MVRVQVDFEVWDHSCFQAFSPEECELEYNASNYIVKAVRKVKN